jgi:hypothetical protein
MATLAALVLFGAAFASEAQRDRTEVFVVERSGTTLSYQLRQTRVDAAQPLSGIRMVLGDFLIEETRMYVLLGEGVPLDEAYLLTSVFMKMGPFKEIRYFHFSRKSGVMLEFKLQQERWRLSFDGSLVLADR